MLLALYFLRNKAEVFRCLLAADQGGLVRLPSLPYQGRRRSLSLKSDRESVLRGCCPRAVWGRELHLKAVSTAPRRLYPPRLTLPTLQGQRPRGTHEGRLTGGVA